MRERETARRFRLSRRMTLFAGLLALASVTVSNCSDAPADGENPAETQVPIGAGLTGPTGTVAELVTSGPPNVSALAEDSLGRLWLATAAFTDTGTDAIYVVTNAGEGLLEVVPGMHTPMGLLWIDDELYVSSIEGITVFRGFDGSRFAEEETILTFPGGGVAGSIVLGVDGRLRVGISAPCNACEPESRWAAAVVSFLPDGSGAEIEVSGIRAAVGLAYIPGTNDLLATMNQRDDLDELTPGDYLAVVASGQDWGFPECYGQGGTACEGVPEPVAELDDHAAVSGVAVLHAATGELSAFVAEWGLARVVRVNITRGDDGSYGGTAEPFLSGIQAPVAVVASDGGTFLVGDWMTGAVYRITLDSGGAVFADS